MNKLRTYFLIFFISSFIIIFFISCFKDPTPTEPPIIYPTYSGALILCEGLWGLNNSSLSRYDFTSKSLIPDYFSEANAGLSLGDISNDIFIRGDTTFISNTTGGYIYAINTSTGKIISKIIFENNSQLRHFTFINDSVAYVSNLLGDCIYKFNPRTLTTNNEKIIVGPAPEGITHYGNYIFVANSGLGDYKANYPKAGTISVIDINIQREINNIQAGPNVVEIFYSKVKNNLYSVYYNLPSAKDSLGAIIEYNSTTLRETQRWQCKALHLTETMTGDTLIFLDSTGVAFIDLKNNPQEIKQLIINPDIRQHWYALSFRADDNTIWIGNANNYQMNGSVIVYNIKNPTAKLFELAVGVNPNSIIFY